MIFFTFVLSSLEFFKLLNINKKIKSYKFILINGPITKKTFLQKKFLGITEYLSKKTNVNDEVMLIYNEKLSVSPVTTHIALKHVSKNISKSSTKKENFIDGEFQDIEDDNDKKI